MVLLTRKKQLAAVEQTDGNLAPGLELPANASIIVLEPLANLDVERIERNLSRDTITAVKDLAGQKAVDFTFGIELKGTPLGTHAAGVPGWSRYLKAAGFREAEVQAFPIGAITASGGGATSTTFRHGETITQATSGATAIVVADWHNGSPEMVVEKDSATGVATPTDAWTGNDTGATTTPTAVPTDEGWAWYPITDPIKTVTFDAPGLTTALAVGDFVRGISSGASGVIETPASISASAVIRFRPIRGVFTDGEAVERVTPNPVASIGDLEVPTGETFVDWAPLSVRRYLDGKATTSNGVRGNVVFNLEVNRQVRMEFTMRGSLNSVADQPLIAGVQYDNATPPLWEGSSIGFAQNDTVGDADVSAESEPCLNTVSVDMGVQLADRKCAGAPNGLLEVRGSDRQASGSMDPEDTLEADIGWLTYVKDSTIARLSMTVGSANGNRFTFKLPGIQFTAASESDREGIAVADMTFNVTGGDLFDLDPGASTPVLSSIGGNNELILIYHTS